MQTHYTKGIVLRTVKFGETSIICTVYTELFGLQSYIVKGIRVNTKRTANKALMFQPGAILALNVYHHPQKNLQYIQSYEWAFLFHNLFSNVINNAVAVFIIEVIQNVLKEPEANPELFYLIEDTLKQADSNNKNLLNNLPIFFLLHLATELGFQIQGECNSANTILNLQEGVFTQALPQHMFYVTNEVATVIATINQIHFYNNLENLIFHKQHRTAAIQALLLFMKLHLPDFKALKTLSILQEVIGS